jgi:hypothetical protein
MAKNTGRGSRVGAVRGRTQVKTSSSTWTKRDSSTGRFVQAKKSAGSFKGVRKEK